MKILIVSQLYPEPDDTGDTKPTKTVEYFAREWIQMGHEIVVAHCSSKFPIFFYLVPQKIKRYISGATSNIFFPMSSRKRLKSEKYGIRLFRFPMFKPFPGCGYSKQSIEKNALQIEKVLNDLNFVPDLVVGHFANPSAELVARLSEVYKAKSSIVFHNDCNERNIVKYRLKDAVQHIGAIGARSLPEANKITKLLSLNRSPFICCSGVPNEVVEKAEITCSKNYPNKGIKHICVAALIKRKNVDVVINAFKHTAAALDTLTIIGGGPQENYIKELAKGDCRITVLGRIPREQVFREMKDANVFTLISYNETYGMVYIEAMLQGCITIASKGGGFDGIINNKENGFLCKAGDQENLETIYKEIMKMSPEERNKIGQAAIDTAIHYSEREVAERYLNDILENQR